MPDTQQAEVKRLLRQAWATPDHAEATKALKALAARLDRTHPDAAASLREGLDDTVTINRLGVSGTLAKTLATTNPMESTIGIVRAHSRNVKRWLGGDMRLRWATALGVDGWERPVSVVHTKAAVTLFSDVVTRDKTGRIVDRTVNGVDPRPGSPNYVYDTAGRLTDWWERDVTAAANASGTYRFSYTGANYTTTCGAVTGGNVNAGKNSNRVEETVTTGAGTVSSVFCYDHADRIQRVTRSSGSNPYVGGFVYDGHGNTTTVGADTMSFDGANRHLKTVSSTTSVEYTRDAADRIVTRKINGTVVSKQAYTGGGDTSDLVVDNGGNLKEITIGLVGGGLYTWRPSAAEVWSHGNTHGDLVLTTNNTGTQTGTIGSYDPFGNPLGVTSIDNADGDLDYGWHGQAQRPLEHQTGLNPTIEMGARPYQTSLGRFLAVDPIEGGTPNDYLYVADPVNGSDLTGRCGVWGNPFTECDERHKGATSIGDWVSDHKDGISTAVAFVGAGVCIVGTAGACAAAIAVGVGVSGVVRYQNTVGKQGWSGGGWDFAAGTAVDIGLAFIPGGRQAGTAATTAGAFRALSTMPRALTTGVRSGARITRAMAAGGRRGYAGFVGRQLASPARGTACSARWVRGC